MYIGRKLDSAPLDMTRFNPAHTALVANEYLGSVTDPRRRAILINFRDHALAEAMGDHEALMATCSKKSQRYEAYTGGDDFSAMQPQSYEALWDYYKALIDLNMYLIHSEPEKIIVGDDELAVEIMVHQVISGRQAIDFFGVTEADPDVIYQAHNRTLVVFVFDEEGKGCGEHAYTGDGGMNMSLMTPIEADQVPEQFYTGPRKVADFFAENPDLEWPEK